MKKNIILASSSPRRKDLLKQIGLSFEIVPSNYEENMELTGSHATVIKKLALGKARDVADRGITGVIIGVDTFVVFDGKRIGKPKSISEAKEMLQRLSDKHVKVYSGMAIIDTYSGKEITDYAFTKITLDTINDKEIDAYIKSKEPLDKAGAFAVQGLGAIFIKEIHGCYTNVVGLPLNLLRKHLNDLGIPIL